MDSKSLEYFCSLKNRNKNLANYVPKSPRLFIAGRKMSQWEKLANEDDSIFKCKFPKPLKEMFGNIESFDYILDSGWEVPYGCGEGSVLTDTVKKIKKVMYNQCVILAECPHKSIPGLYSIVLLSKEPYQYFTEIELDEDISAIKFDDFSKWIKTSEILFDYSLGEHFTTFPSEKLAVSDDLVAYVKKCEAEMDADYNKRHAFIPEDILKTKIIKDYQYAYNSELSSVIIPYGVKVIGKRAFKGCSNLKEVYIPDSVIEIGEEAFCGCRNLIRIRFPNTISEIKWDVLAWCFDIQAIVIPSSVVRIFSELIKSNTELRTVYGKPGSRAESFAKKYKLQFVSMEDL